MSEQKTLTKLMHEVAHRCPEGRIPDTYLVFDTETNGTDVYTCKILQLGFCVVREGEVVDSMAFLVKRDPSLPIPEAAARVHGITHEILQAEGIEPEEIMPFVRETLEKWREEGKMIVGHNIMSFDARLLELELKLMGIPWMFGENELIDTGMLVKASRLGMFFRDETESLRDFYRRAAEIRARGVYWSLDRYCLKAYGLEKYGIEKDKLHDAGADCSATHFLLKELGRRAFGDN